MLKKSLFNFLLAVFLSGCVTVPKQTGELTVMLGNQIVESKITHLSLIDEWAKQRRERAEQFLEYRWVPTFIMNFMDESGEPYKNLQTVMKNDCRRDRADEVQAIVDAISKQIEKKRKELLGEIDNQVQSLRDRVTLHYADIERMHRVILSNIQSAIKGSEFEKDIRDAMLKPLKEIAPIKEASEKLDALLK